VTSVIDFLGRYQLPIIIGSFVIVIVSNIVNFRRGRS
jgi:hypothetical protein